MAGAVELLGNMNGMDNRATPLLAICIPTHNRREVLEECLASVLPQADALGVGVIVSDNGSSDGTWPALETLKLQYPWMQIMRHTRDIGYRDNLTGVVLSSHAHYVWPINDKLVLLPGALEYVMSVLVHLHPDAIIVNAPSGIVSTVEKEYSTPQSCLTELGWWTSVTGATVLPRQAFVDALHIQPLSRPHSHVVALFSYLASMPAPRVLFSGQAVIQPGEIAIANHIASSVMLADRLEVSGRSWYDAVMNLPALYSTGDKLQMLRSHSMLGFRMLLRLRAAGQLSLQRLNTDEVPLRATISVPWWSAVSISVAPRWMLRPFLHVHPRRMLLAMRGRLRSLRGQQAHRSAR